MAGHLTVISDLVIINNEMVLDPVHAVSFIQQAEAIILYPAVCKWRFFLKSLSCEE